MGTQYPFPNFPSFPSVHARSGLTILIPCLPFGPKRPHGKFLNGYCVPDLNEELAVLGDDFTLGRDRHLVDQSVEVELALVLTDTVGIADGEMDRAEGLLGLEHIGANPGALVRADAELADDLPRFVPPDRLDDLGDALALEVHQLGVLERPLPVAELIVDEADDDLPRARLLARGRVALAGRA